MTALSNAIAWTAEAFAEKVDRQGQPAIFHALRVMMAGQTENERIVGVLHDVVEDSLITLDDIAFDFDSEIVNAIDALTRREAYETYREYIQRLAPNDLARAVKLADLADNIERAKDLPPAEAASLRKRYYEAMHVLSMWGHNSEPPASLSSTSDDSKGRTE